MNFIVTQVKNEKSRIKEWVEYHLKNGFDKIVIYLDHPTDGSEEVLNEIVDQNKNVVWFYTNHGKTMNYKSANDYAGNVGVVNGIKQSFERGLNYIKENYQVTYKDWVAFIDVDEFIVKTGEINFNIFLDNLDEKIDRLYIPSYDMKCPINLNNSVIEQSLYRWSDETRNSSVFVSRGKAVSRVFNLFEIKCVHCLDFNKDMNPHTKTKVMSTGGKLIEKNNSVVIDVYHSKEYFKLFHYRNDSLLQVYDQYDDSALINKNND